MRLLGLVAHLAVILGGQGQMLTLRHDSTRRDWSAPSVLLAIRKVMNLTGLVEGLGTLVGFTACFIVTTDKCARVVAWLVRRRRWAAAVALLPWEPNCCDPQCSESARAHRGRA